MISLRLFFEQSKEMKGKTSEENERRLIPQKKIFVQKEMKSPDVRKVASFSEEKITSLNLDSFFSKGPKWAIATKERYLFCLRNIKGKNISPSVRTFSIEETSQQFIFARHPCYAKTTRQSQRALRETA
jgi:hypothetical protein